MKKLLIVFLVFVVAMTFGISGAFAVQSAKATAQVGDVSAIPLDGQFHTIFDQWIKVPTFKDLFIDVSLECGLVTNTKVMSKALQRAVATAEAMVKVRVLVNGVPIKVGNFDLLTPDTEITYARREQTLIAEFAGSLAIPDGETWGDCLEVGAGNITRIKPGCLEEESLQLILDTMNANSFNFVAPDLPQGEYYIEVQAMLDYTAQVPEYTDADAKATTALLGHGSVTIETVRMIKSEDVLVDLD